MLYTIGKSHVFLSFFFLQTAGTKEAAFTHAIISAGIAHAVTLACTKKNFSRCDCDRSKAEGKAKSGVDGWSWRGCSVNIQRGIQVAKTFLDGQDPDQSDIALMNKHNNEVGREVSNFMLSLTVRSILYALTEYNACNICI
jgi:wingless-type MMTV integration site family protein 7